MMKPMIALLSILAVVACQRGSQRVPDGTGPLHDSLQVITNSFFRAAMTHDSLTATDFACDSVAVGGAMRLDKRDSIVFASLPAATAGAPQLFGTDTVAMRFVVPQDAKDSAIATVTFVRRDGHWRVCRFMVPDNI